MTHSVFKCLVAGAALLTLTTPAFAQDENEQNSETSPGVEAASGAATTSKASPPSEEGSEAPPSAKMHIAVPPPPASVQRKDYVHEGFYFRVSVGAGLLSTTLQDTEADTSDSSSSFALGTDVLVGGSPSPGMTIGGGVLSDIGFVSNFDDSSGPVLQLLAGPFFDAFPDSKGGWHLGTMIGGAGGTVASDITSGALFGGGASAWGGGDLWVAPDWSAGFKIRLTGAHMVGDGASATNFSGQFLITILNH